MFLYAPLAILFINTISHSSATITMSYSSVATSIAIFLGIPLGAAIITRFGVRKLAGPAWYDVFLK
jgi:ACR3 family arsenite transporter